MRMWQPARLLAASSALVLAAALGAMGARAVEDRTDGNAPRTAALSAGARFLDTYVDPDGRVVRRDEGGDTVSEGQAYAMLVAVALGDRERFDTVWEWTRRHLLRPDDLVSWRWVDGAVADPNNAADADLDIVRALALAAERFDKPGYDQDARRIATSLLERSSFSVGTATVAAGEVPPPPGQGVAGVGRVLSAGNWADTVPYVVNPSYFSPRAEAASAAVTGDPRWAELTRTHRVIGWQLVGTGLLPPDWARVDAYGGAISGPPAAGGPVLFGLDAARFAIRMAESCDPADRELAAALRPLLVTPDPPPARRHLDATPAADWQHPVAAVAGAAAALAAGDREDAARRLGTADSVAAQHPTYYGAAWAALGRIMLTTDLLDGCGEAVR